MSWIRRVPKAPFGTSLPLTSEAGRHRPRKIVGRPGLAALKASFGARDALKGPFGALGAAKAPLGALGAAKVPFSSQASTGSAGVLSDRVAADRASDVKEVLS